MNQISLSFLLLHHLLWLKTPLEEDYEDVCDTHAEHRPPEAGTPSNYCLKYPLNLLSFRELYQGFANIYNIKIQE